MRLFTIIILLAVGCGSGASGKPKTDTTQDEVPGQDELPGADGGPDVVSPDACEPLSGVWDFRFGTVDDGCNLKATNAIVDFDTAPGSDDPIDLQKYCGEAAIYTEGSNDVSEDTCEQALYLKCEYEGGYTTTWTWLLAPDGDKVFRGKMSVQISDPETGVCKSEFETVGVPYQL